MKYCPKCNACNLNDNEKCFKCNYSFTSDNSEDNTISTIEEKSDNINSTITHQQISDSDTTIETSSENDEMPHNNAIATVIRVIAVLTYICGFIAGIVFAANQPSYSSLYGSHSNQFSWVVAFIWWGASFISGTFILGFSEIIKLLNDIKNKK